MCEPEGVSRDTTIVDEIVDTLCHPVRRDIIADFEDRSPETTMTLEELVAHQADRLPDRSRDRLSMELQQIHLAKLESGGWLDYDTRSGLITYHGHPEAERVMRDLLRVFTD